MSHRSRAVLLAVLLVPGYAALASAETLRCRAVNGNVNCAGSGGVSCQTVNGRTVCVGGRGEVVQSFGGGSREAPDDDGEASSDQGWAERGRD